MAAARSGTDTKLNWPCFPRSAFHLVQDVGQRRIAVILFSKDSVIGKAGSDLAQRRTLARIAGAACRPQHHPQLARGGGPQGAQGFFEAGRRVGKIHDHAGGGAASGRTDHQFHPPRNAPERRQARHQLIGSGPQVRRRRHARQRIGDVKTPDHGQVRRELAQRRKHLEMQTVRRFPYSACLPVGVLALCRIGHFGGGDAAQLGRPRIVGVQDSKGGAFDEFAFVGKIVFQRAVKIQMLAELRCVQTATAHGTPRTRSRASA